MELFWLIGAVIFITVYLFDRKVLKLDKSIVWHFTQVILIGSAAAIVLNGLIGRFPPLPDHLGFGSLLMVGWEDLVFSLLPIYYGRKYLHPRIATILTIIASLAFGLGHIYQGYFWALITCFYPYFISYKCGRKYGYGTIMALHVIYDVSVVAIVYILNFIGKINAI